MAEQGAGAACGWLEVKYTGRGAPPRGAMSVPVFLGGKMTKWCEDLDKKWRGSMRRAMKAGGFTGRKGSVLDAPGVGGDAVDRVVFYGLGAAKEAGALDFEDMGGRVAGASRGSGASKSVSVALRGLEEFGGVLSEAEAAAHVGAGARLGSYRFVKHRGGPREGEGESWASWSAVTVLTGNSGKARAFDERLSAGVEGALLARELSNEPANVLTTDEFVKRAKALSRGTGLKVEVLGEAEMASLKMGALLGVGQGSASESRLLVLRWNGGEKGEAPVVGVGKGVCFDSGGLSLKPPGGMEDMKGDMGGAAAVAGGLLALARRGAKLNAMGVIGLVENMPSGEAQRPGDVVTSMSGKTIEVLNTDAEGRLVLADALWWSQTKGIEKGKPRAMVDFATLTGAMVVALGRTRAGLFSNDDGLSEAISKAGDGVGEKVWRLPMDKEYDRYLNSKTADMKNIGGGRNAGSITAASFLARFVKKGVSWAHVDIAGVAMGSPTTAVNRSWASGFGARLFDRLCEEAFE